MRTDLYLPGTPQNASPLRPCNGPCGREKPPEGGVQMNASKWVCATCWRARMAGSRK